MKKALLALSFILVSCHFSNAQNVGNYLGDEKFMYAETKQVNQFFRRFNCEEGNFRERGFTKATQTITTRRSARAISACCSTSKTRTSPNR